MREKKFNKKKLKKKIFLKKNLILHFAKNKLFYGIFTIMVIRFIIKNYQKVGKVSKIDDSCFK